MKNKVLKVAIAVSLIITLTIANFILVGMNLVTYALENIDNSTSNENVKFAAYFKTKEGKEVSEAGYPINNQEMKLYIQVSIQEGEYFDGVITLKDSNFKLKEQSSSSYIEKIEGNTITLNRIRTGNVAEIELGIEPIMQEAYGENMLSQESILSLTGSYKGTEKNPVSIQADKKVALTLLAPESLNTALNAKVITNRKYKIGEEEVRLVQIELDSSVVNNAYPIKASTFELELPEGAKLVEVISKGTYATNGEADKKLTYNEPENNKLKLVIENTSKNGKISWKKDATDSIIVTLKLDKDAEIVANEYSVKAKIEFQGTEQISKALDVKYNLVNDADGIIRTSTENKEEIYKGKIYSKEDREYIETTNIEVNYANLIESATLKETTAYRVEKNASDLEANVQYKTTTISKQEVQKILGTEGKLIIGDIEITNATEADKNGNIVITHQPGVKELQVQITKAISTGIIRLNHTKVIKAETYTRQQISQIQYLIDKAEVKYETAIYSFETIKQLRETTSEVVLTVPEKISAIESSEDIEVTITLKTDNEKYELYQNPVFTLTMPEGVTVNSVSNGAVSASSEELTISKLETDGQRQITLQIVGDQQKYLTSNINTQIKFKANVSVRKLMANKQETIKMQYTNKGVTYNIETAPVSVISSNSKILTHLEVKNYNGLGTTLEKYSDSTAEVKGEIPVENTVEIEVPIKYTIINNYSSEIKLMSILEARLTDKDEQTKILINNMDTELVMAAGEIKVIEKVLKIPAGMYYSEKIDINTLIEYTYLGTEYNTKNHIKLITEQKLGIRDIRVIDEKLQLETFAQLGDGTGIKNTDEVFKEQIVKYIVEVTNISNQPISNIKITNTQENGNLFDLQEVEVINWVTSNEPFIEHEYEELDTNTKTVEIETLQPGESKEIVYQVVAKKTAQSDTTSANISLAAEGITSQEVKISNKVKEANLKIYTKRALKEEVQLYGNSTFQMLTYVKNLTDSQINNSKVRIFLSEGFTYDKNSKLEALDKNLNELDILSDIKYNKEENYIELNVKTLEAGQEIILSSYIQIKSLPLEVLTSEELIYTTINDIVSNSTLINVKQAETKLSIEQSVNIAEGQKVKNGEKVVITVKVTNIGYIDTIANAEYNLPAGLEVQKIEITKNGEIVDNTSVVVGSSISIPVKLAKGEDFIAKIETIVNTSKIVSEEITIKSWAFPKEGAIANTENITIQIESDIDTNLGWQEPEEGPKEEDINKDPENQEPGNEPGDKPGDEPGDVPGDEPGDEPSDVPGDKPGDEPGNKPGEDKEEPTYTITGLAWVDKNKNAQIESGESIKGITVQVIDLDNKNTFVKDKNGNIIEAKTNANGEYKIENIPEGNYNLIFKYDTSLYELKANTEMKDYIVETTKEKVAITNNINLKADVTIDLVLVELQEFDLKVDKYISKVIVQTANGTKTSVYSNQKLVKEEIATKYLTGATVLVEYTMQVRNIGELAGFATEIVDYLPTDMKFHSELNTQWYVGEDGNLYNTSLATSSINPGESKTIKLVLIKTMTQDNTGTTPNIVEITDVMNSKEYVDIDTTNNQSKAEIIINPATGTVITYTIAIINSIVIALVGTYLIKRKVMK